MQARETTNGIDYHSLGYRKILLAEDMIFNQFIARQMLEGWGFDVCLANNGLEALGLLKKEDFDCILMDIQMPEMDGLEAARLIRKLPEPIKATIPIIAVTANVLKGNSEKYLAAGITDLLAKPLEESKLFQIISKNLKKDKMNSKENEYSECIPLMHPAKEEKLYDLTMVRSVSGGDEEFIKKMVQLFIDTVPPNVSELVLSMQKENWDQVAKLAHKLKSTVDSMGITDLKAVIRTVESHAKMKESLNEMPELVETIRSVISACGEQLKKDILS